jgi:hypothetical protein
MKQYQVMRIFADGVERKRTLKELAREIEKDNPRAVVEIISNRQGRIWNGHAEYITADLRDDYLKHCVQEIQQDEYGITLIMR